MYIPRGKAPVVNQVRHQGQIGTKGPRRVAHDGDRRAFGPHPGSARCGSLDRLVRTRAGFLLILLLTGSLAGCIGAKPVETPTPTLPTLPPIPELDVFQFEDCTQIVMLFASSPAVVARVVPDAFEPFGLTPGDAALLAFGAECGRVADKQAVYGAVSLFWTIAFATPKNLSWTASGYIDYYVFDFVVSSQPLSDAMNRLGLGTRVGTVSAMKQPLPTAGQVWAWDVRAGDIAASFAHRMNSEDPQPNPAKAFLWFGQGPFVRVARNATSTVDILINSGEMVMTGPSRFLEARPGPGPFVGTSDVSLQQVFSVSRELYQ